MISGLEWLSKKGGEIAGTIEYNFKNSSVNKAVNYYSDKNLKSNIDTLDNSLNKIKLIGGYSHYWRVDTLKIPAKRDIGLIAQEVEKVFPEIVSEDSIGYKQIAYYKLIPILIESIKEQQILIEELQKRINKYEEKEKYSSKSSN